MWTDPTAPCHTPNPQSKNLDMFGFDPSRFFLEGKGGDLIFPGIPRFLDPGFSVAGILAKRFCRVVKCVASCVCVACTYKALVLTPPSPGLRQIFRGIPITVTEIDPS